MRSDYQLDIGLFKTYAEVRKLPLPFPFCSTLSLILLKGEGTPPKCHSSCAFIRQNTIIRFDENFGLPSKTAQSH
jgi:hypothetical protein